MTALPLDLPEDWYFATSESKAVALHGGFVDKLRDNAPRIVGTMKAIADATTIMTGDPLMMIYATFAITGRFISILWGTKANQKKMSAHHSEKADKLAERGFLNSAKKIFYPREYPVEASAGMSTIAEVFDAGYGGKLMLTKTIGEGITPLLTGLLAVWSYGNILFGKEKKKNEIEEQNPQGEALHFSKSESKSVGFIGRWREKAKGNPVMVSSIMLVGICAVSLVGTIVGGNDPAYIAAIGIALVANIIQTLLIRKNEFNIEGAQDEAKLREAPVSFQERLSRHRDNEPGLAFA